LKEYKKIALFTLFCSLAIWNSIAQNYEGTPLITNYLPDQYNADAQNWQCILANNGYLYSANNNGVLEFDGSTWRLIKSTGLDAVRSLAEDDKGTIFVGGTGDFGFLQPDSTGKLQFISLAKKFVADKFDQVWRTIVIDQAVYFFAGRNLIFKYANHTVTKIKIPSNFARFRGHKIKNRVYVADVFQGLGMVVGDSVVSHTLGLSIAQQNIYAMIPFDKNQILIGTYKSGFYIYNTAVTDSMLKLKTLNIAEHDKKAFTKFTTTADSLIIPGEIYTGARLTNGNFVVGTLRNGMFIFNKQGQVLLHLNKSTGMSTSEVFNVSIDKDENLWCGTGNGIVQVAANLPFTFFGAQNGIETTINAITIFENRLYAGSYAGIFTKQLNSQGKYSRALMNRIENSNIYCLNFLKVKVPEYKKDILLAATLREIVRLENGEVTETIMPLYAAYSMVESKVLPGRVYFGHSTGITIVDFIYNKATKKVSTLFMGTVKDANEEFRNLITDNQGNIWGGTTSGSLYKIRYTDEYSLQTPNIQVFDTKNGLPEKASCYPFLLDGNIYIGTVKGIFKPEYQADTISRFVKAKKEFGFFASDSMHIQAVFKASNNSIWFGTGRGLYMKKPDGTILSEPFRIFPYESEYSQIYEQDKKNMWFVTGKRIMCYTTDFGTLPQTNVSARLRRIITGENDTLYNGYSELFFKGYSVNFTGEKGMLIKRIGSDKNSIKFEFSAPFFTHVDKIQYRYRMQGLDKNWSKWQAETFKEYNFLPPGNYVFELQAQNIFGVVSKVTTFGFKVASPWYSSLLAIIIYVILSACFMYLAFRINSMRLKRANVRLEEIVKARTIEIEQQNKKIKLQTRKLEASNSELERLSLVARETDNAVTILSTGLMPIWINEGFKQMYGYTLEEFHENKQLYIKLNTIARELSDECIKTGKSVTLIARTYTKLKNIVWYQTTINPIYNPQGELQKFIIVDSDITQIKEAETEILAQRNEIESQRDQIAKQNSEITDSILYAERIQKAVFPPTDYLSEILPEYFILNKPRNIVSGDFYWASKNRNQVLFAVADSTGHGVPGAFMSLLGITWLTTITDTMSQFDPSKILTRLRAEIMYTLHQRGEQGEANDGIEMALCLIDFDKMKLTYAGANRPVYLVRNKTEIIKLNPAKMPLGIMYADEKTFFNESINLTKGDTLYLFTDGYADQFGGKDDRKFLIKNFKQLLLSIQDLDLDAQKIVLEKEITDWIGYGDQVDDILVVGLRV